MIAGLMLAVVALYAPARAGEPHTAAYSSSDYVKMVASPTSIRVEFVVHAPPNVAMFGNPPPATDDAESLFSSRFGDLRIDDHGIDEAFRHSAVVSTPSTSGDAAGVVLTSSAFLERAPSEVNSWHAMRVTLWSPARDVVEPYDVVLALDGLRATGSLPRSDSRYGNAWHVRPSACPSSIFVRLAATALPASDLSVVAERPETVFDPTTSHALVLVYGLLSIVPALWLLALCGGQSRMRRELIVVAGLTLTPVLLQSATAVAQAIESGVTGGAAVLSSAPDNSAVRSVWADACANQGTSSTSRQLPRIVAHSPTEPNSNEDTTRTSERVDAVSGRAEINSALACFSGLLSLVASIVLVLLALATKLIRPQRLRDWLADSIAALVLSTLLVSAGCATAEILDAMPQLSAGSSAFVDAVLAAIAATISAGTAIISMRWAAQIASDRRKAFILATAVTLVAVLALCLSLFQSGAVLGTSTASIHRPAFSAFDSGARSLAAVYLDFGWAFVLLAVLAIFAHRARSKPSVAKIDLAYMVFACFVVGPTATVLFVPVPFILALLGFWMLVYAERPTVAALERTANLDATDRAALFRKALDLLDSRALGESLSDVRGRVASGELSLSDYEARRDDILAQRRNVERNRFVEDELPLDDVILGTMSTAWESDTTLGVVRDTAPYSVGMAGAEFALYKQAAFLRTFTPSNVLYHTAGLFANWSGVPFVLASAYNNIRGQSGFRKGLLMGMLSSACLIPQWAFLYGFAELAARTAGQVVFCAGVGFLLIDLPAYGRAREAGCDWKTFCKIAGFNALPAALPVLAAAGGELLKTIVVEPISALVVGLLTHR